MNTCHTSNEKLKLNINKLIIKNIYNSFRSVVFLPGRQYTKENNAREYLNFIFGLIFFHQKWHPEVEIDGIFSTEILMNSKPCDKKVVETTNVTCITRGTICRKGLRR